MAEKSRVLVIGSTGCIGKFIVEASAKFGHPTFALVRESILSDPAKANIAEGFKSLGVNLVYGDIYDQESLLTAIKQVDVVISAVGQTQVEIQDRIVAAIKAAGNIKRFFPSEIGNDVDCVHALESAKALLAIKAKIRCLVEAEGIPYTYLKATVPPRDKVVILGDGNVKVVNNEEDDIGTYNIKAVDDPRTLNTTLYIRPPANAYSMNDLVSLWERKIGKTREQVYVPEEQVLKNIQACEIISISSFDWSAFPLNHMLAIYHSIFVKGDQTSFEIEPSFGVEALELYPDVKCATVD
ncbi:hypothetical protein EUGRSUZ_B01246 [Eucalyptus grandis]|uniref:Uncharacterized protein n=1 Tax=Eucalyptus grandis TaxID=71139 RepID=A0ACC3LQ91_EUCGR|nr:hypothetical protein EUGRSUZ_B01246 [Eucalyptus grandis]